jgi:hypothetical protein
MSPLLTIQLIRRHHDWIPRSSVEATVEASVAMLAYPLGQTGILIALQIGEMT